MSDSARFWADCILVKTRVTGKLTKPLMDTGTELEDQEVSPESTSHCRSSVTTATMGESSRAWVAWRT